MQNALATAIEQPAVRAMTRNSIFLLRNAVVRECLPNFPREYLFMLSLAYKKALHTCLITTVLA